MRDIGIAKGSVVGVLALTVILSQLAQISIAADAISLRIRWGEARVAKT